MLSTIPGSQPQVSCGVDYITVTAQRAENIRALLYFCEDLEDQEEGCGGIRKPWRWQGFAGSTVGGLSYGFNGTRALCRASGSTARDSAAQLIECADNVARLDVQATVRSGALGRDYAKDLYASLLGVGRGRGRPIARTLITSTYTGDTLYLGRRISDSYGRIYNKSAEEKSDEDPPRWRYEVEYKRKPAFAAAKSFSSAPSADSWCLAEVGAWFDRRDCPLPVSTGSPVGSPGDPRGADAQARRIQWLRQGVRPVVVALAREYGWPDVLALLGVPMAYSDRYVNEVLGPAEDS